MTEVTVHPAGTEAPVRIEAPDRPETATESLTKSAADVAVRTDSKGRKIGVRKITALQLYRLTKMLGEVPGSTLQIAMNAVSCVSIDGDQVPFPTKESEIEFVIQRLGFEGMAALTDQIAEWGKDGSAEAANAKN